MVCGKALGDAISGLIFGQTDYDNGARLSKVFAVSPEEGWTFTLGGRAKEPTDLNKISPS